jgi:hypothetical protein
MYILISYYIFLDIIDSCIVSGTFQMDTVMDLVMDETIDDMTLEDVQVLQFQDDDEEIEEGQGSRTNTIRLIKLFINILTMFCIWLFVFSHSLCI